MLGIGSIGHIGSGVTGIALNAPSLVVEEGGEPTHAVDEGADLEALATVDDDDGETTTGVDLYDGASLLGAMTNEGGGVWSRGISDVTEGTRNYQALRHTAAGDVGSNVWTVEVSSVGTFVIAGPGNQVIAGPGNRVTANS